LPEYTQRRDLRRLQDLDKWLVEYAGEHNWRNPTISFDVISGWLNAGAFTTSGYEQSHELIEFHPLLGGNIMGSEESTSASLLANSDILILTTLQKSGVYPFYQHTAQYWNDLKAWADENMILIKTVPFDGFTATLYARPSATLSGLSDGWITDEGLLVKAPRVALQRFPKIRLSGRAVSSRLAKAPGVAATVDAGTDRQSVPASFKQIGNGYEIVIDTSMIELPPSDSITLGLHFDTYFVPKSIVQSGDDRKLVVPTPTRVELIRTGS
jgi:hypothetical protein